MLTPARPGQLVIRMLVCICKGVSDRRITEEIRRGACTLQAIQEGCQAGTDCKSCVRQIRQMLIGQGRGRQDSADLGGCSGSVCG